MSQQGLRQASFRAIGSTATDYGGDALAAFAAEATIPAGATFNGAFILWLQERLGSASTNINDLMAEFAAAEGADNAGTVGSFDPSTTPLEEAEAVIAGLDPLAWWKFDEGAGQVVINYGSAGAGANLTLGTDATVTADDPAWTASGLAFTAAGSDVAHCPGGTGGLGITGTDPFTFIYVGKSSGTGSTALMAGQWNNSTSAGQRRTLRAISATGLKLRYEVEGGGHTSALAVVENAWHFVGVTGTHGNLQDAILYANGASEAASGASSAVVNTADNAPRFSFGWANTAPQTCEVAYGLAWESVLTPTQVANVRAALTTIMAARGITLP